MAVSEALGERREVELPQGTIRYRERGSGEPVLLVHGVLVNGDLWREVVPRLVDAGFRCVVPDLPLGAHEVPVREDADLSPPGLARLIADFAEAAGASGATLVGNDTGGALAQLVAVNHPEAIGRLVLTSCDAFEHFFPWMFRYLQAVARVPGAVASLRSAGKLRAVRRSPLAFGWLMAKDPPREVLEAWTAPLADAGVRRDVTKVLRGVNRRHTLEAAERLRSFGRPALLAWGDRDRVFPLADAERLARVLPDARLEVVRDSYAFVPEDQPAELARLIVEFLR